jgi:hypothetical protein
MIRRPKMKHKMIITVEGGLIQDIQGIPYGLEVEVRDYDIDHTENEALKEDEDGNKYIEIIHESSEDCYHSDKLFILESLKARLLFLSALQRQILALETMICGQEEKP